MEFEEKPAVKDKGTELIADDIISPNDLESTSGEDETRRLGETDTAQQQQQQSKASGTPKAQEIRSGEIVADKFRIKSKLGKGGMGDVYLAEQIFTKKDVAIKFLAPNQNLQPERWMRFQQEARVLAKLNHPLIIRVMDFDLSQEHGPYIVMEYFEGEALSSIISRTKKLNPDFVAEVCRQVADALQYAHAIGVVHRDIKPSNIMVAHKPGTPPAVRIVDFGIAKWQTADDENLALTKTGQLMGSPLYMSPEQCLGETCDARSDIYSLGCVMYEALSGKAPFVGKSYADTIHKHVEDKPSTFADELKVPSNMQRIVLSALEKKPSDRFQSMSEFRAALEGFLKGRRVSVPMSARKLLNLTLFFLMLMPISVIVLTKMIIASEPLKSAQMIGQLTLPDPVIAFLMPDAEVADAVKTVQAAETVYRNQKYKMAENMLKGVAEANPKYVNLTLFPLARSLAMQGKHGEAEALLKQMAGGSELGTARNVHVVGYILTTEDHWDQAMPFFRSARDLYLKAQGPESIEATKDMANIGYGASQAGNKKEARENYQRAYDILSKHLEAYPGVRQAAKSWLDENR